jgi:membrane fusion protein (multidrug efflux system)
METRQAPAAPPDGQQAPPQQNPQAPQGGPPPAQAAPEPKRPMNPVLRIVLIAVGAVVLVLALIFGIRFLAYASTHQTTDDAQIDADQVAITSKITERVDKILVDTNQEVSKGQLLIQLDSRDEAQRVAQARASADAEDAQARAAQANVDLTRDTQKAQNQQNNGSISQAEATITGAGQQARSADQQIAVAQATLDAARAQLQSSKDAVPGAYQNLQKTQADLRRTQSLVSTGDVAVSQLDAARASYQAALAGYRQAQASVSAASAQVLEAQQRVDAQRYAASSTAAQVAAAQGSLTTAQGHLLESDSPYRVPAEQAQAQAAAAQTETAHAQLKTALDQLSYTQIHSPIEGFVGEKNVEIGATVQPGQTLMTIVPANHIYVTANFKETQIGHMHTGQDVDINVDAYSGVKFYGRVQTISPASENKFSLVPAQNATGNFVKVTQRVPVRIVFVDPDPKYPLRPGMSVEASVKVK